MSRFITLDQSDIDDILKEKDSKSTNKATEQSWRVFLAYCSEKEIEIDAELVDKKHLDKILKSFYMEARQVNGKAYTKKSFDFGIKNMDSPPQKKQITITNCSNIVINL